MERQNPGSYSTNIWCQQIISTTGITQIQTESTGLWRMIKQKQHKQYKNTPITNLSTMPGGRITTALDNAVSSVDPPIDMSKLNSPSECRHKTRKKRQARKDSSLDGVNTRHCNQTTTRSGCMRRNVATNPSAATEIKTRKPLQLQNKIVKNDAFADNRKRSITTIRRGTGDCWR